MPNYGAMSDKDLELATKEQQDKDNLPVSDAIDLQIEMCKRAGKKFELPDGTVAYEPPDWRGP